MEFAGLLRDTTRPLTVWVFQMLDTDGDLSMRDRRHDADDGRWRDDDYDRPGGIPSRFRSRQAAAGMPRRGPG